VEAQEKRLQGKQDEGDMACSNGSEDLPWFELVIDIYRVKHMERKERNGIIARLRCEYLKL
jgi:hypothetical protein